MFKDELDAAYAACPVVYFPYGLCEPHGPQNTVGLDALKAHGICCRAARAHGGIVAPPDYWHIQEIGGFGLWNHGSVGQHAPHFMTAMPPWQHFKNICYHIRAADVQAFHAAIFLTGHAGPNYLDMKTLFELVQPHVGTRLCCLADHEANQPGFNNDGKMCGDHAGCVETSLAWALEPDCVDLSRLPPQPGEMVDHFAMGKTADQSNRKTGERMVADEVRFLGNKSIELRNAYESASPVHTLRTFEQVEKLWADVILPELPKFLTMQPRWSPQWSHQENPTLPPESCWAENQPVPDIPGVTRPR